MDVVAKNEYEVNALSDLHQVLLRGSDLGTLRLGNYTLFHKDFIY